MDKNEFKNQFFDIAKSDVNAAYTRGISIACDTLSGSVAIKYRKHDSSFGFIKIPSYEVIRRFMTKEEAIDFLLTLYGNNDTSS